MKEIKLRDGVFALVDDDVYESIKDYRWCLFRCFGQKDYACRYVWPNGKQIRIFLHRQVLPHDLPHTDHVDGNGLNNQRANLRPAYCYQNIANSGKRKNNTSGFKGVFLDKRTQKWTAAVKDVNRKSRIHLGVFADRISAALAYDKAARDTYGEFAVTNFQVNKPPTEKTE